MAELINKIRTRLLLDQPFFGSLAMRLELVNDPSVETVQTNGTVLKYNEAFLKTLTTAEQSGIMAHEVMHCAVLHIYRRNGRDAEMWNKACDYAINPVLKAQGMQLPSKALFNPQFAGMHAEQIYSKMQSQKAQQGSSGQPQPGAGQSGNQQSPQGPQAPGNANGTSSMPGCPTGEFTDAPTPEEAGESATMSETDWAVATEQAAKVAQAGKLPAGMGLEIKNSRVPVVDWVSELREFVTHTLPSDYSWTAPNRRYMAQGIYLPGITNENTGELVVAIDTSGSCLSCLPQFVAELKGIVRECRPEKVTVIYCDYAVAAVEEFSADDFDVATKPAGGGGTRFTPVFQYIEENGIQPVAMVYLTDLYGDTPVEPEYPTLWVAPLWSTADVPFGRRLTMVEAT